MKPSSFVVKRADRDLSALRGEFHGVVDQVPQHLLKPDAISQDVTLFRLKLGRDDQLLCCDRRVCRLDRVFDNCVRVAIYQFEMKLPAINPGKVEQVVNQSGLQLHVALNNLNILDELWRKFLRVILEVGGCCQCRRQGRAQFMAECCQKIVLRLACFLRCNFFRFKLPAPYLVSDVACDFGETANFPGLIMKRSNDNLPLEGLSVFSDSQTLITYISATSCFSLIAWRFAGGNVVFCVDRGKILPD